jgi:hypothetical protein
MNKYLKFILFLFSSFFLFACSTKVKPNTDIYSNEYAPNYEVYADNALLNRLANELNEWLGYRHIYGISPDILTLRNDDAGESVDIKTKTSKNYDSSTELGLDLKLSISYYPSGVGSSEANLFSEENLPILLGKIYPEVDEEEAISLSKYILKDLEKQGSYEDSQLDVSVLTEDGIILFYTLVLTIPEDKDASFIENLENLTYESDENIKGFYKDTTINDILNNYNDNDGGNVKKITDYVITPVSVVGRIVSRESTELSILGYKTTYLIEDEYGNSLKVNYLKSDDVLITEDMIFNTGDMVEFKGISQNINSYIHASRAEFIR